jgi:hypothetical protein
MKAKGVLMLGLCAKDVNPIYLHALRQDGYEIWTVNDWYSVYPELIPDRVYQIHKDASPHTDDLGNTRDARKVSEKCTELAIECIHSLSAESYKLYYAKQPEHWYQSTMNYMFVDIWDLIQSDMIGAHIIIEGMPLEGDGERQVQRQFMVSAVEMSILRGIKVDARHWHLWKQPPTIPWHRVRDLETYGITQRDHGVIHNMIAEAVNATDLTLTEGTDNNV